MTMIRPRSDVVYGIYRGLPSGTEVRDLHLRVTFCDVVVLFTV